MLTRVVLALLIALATVITGCDAGEPGETPPESAVAATPSPDEADSIRLRTSMGLRSDIAWIRAVAADPRSSLEYSVPLLPEEIAEIDARAVNADAVVVAIDRYTAAHADEFGGLYLDQEHAAGAVTTLWTAHLDQHAAAMRALVHPTARIAFKAARFTYAELRAFQDRISADWGWMRDVGIAPMGVGVDIIANRVEIDVSSADPDAAPIVTDYYAAPPGMLAVISDGTGAALIRSGTIRGRVLDANGRPPGERLVTELILQWTSDGPGDCGGGDIGYGLLGDGSFELPCQAGGHTIQVQIGIPDAGWQTIASGHVVAIADAVVNLEIRLDGPWPAPPGP